MDVDYLKSVFADGLSQYNKQSKEQIQLISATYEGPTSSPKNLLVQVTVLTENVVEGCLAPLLVLVNGIFENSSKEVFPKSLDVIRFRCYDKNSVLKLDYQVAFSDAVAFGVSQKIDVDKILFTKDNTAPPTTTPRPVSTKTAAPLNISTPVANCSPSYPGVCIPPPPPNLDCKDVKYKRFKVLPADPHGFDTDGDGIGCES